MKTMPSEIDDMTTLKSSCMVMEGNGIPSCNGQEMAAVCGRQVVNIEGEDFEEAHGQGRIATDRGGKKERTLARLTDG